MRYPSKGIDTIQYNRYYCLAILWKALERNSIEVKKKSVFRNQVFMQKILSSMEFEIMSYGSLKYAQCLLIIGATATDIQNMSGWAMGFYLFYWLTKSLFYKNYISKQIPNKRHSFVFIRLYNLLTNLISCRIYIYPHLKVAHFEPVQRPERF